MQLGLVGLGKMGANMRTRIQSAGHEVVGYDLNPDVRDVDSLQAMVDRLAAPRAVWVMLPSGPVTDGTVSELVEMLEPGDVIVEGGNSRYVDDFRHDELAAAKGIGYLDCGVSGGIWGAENGYGLMVGGRPEHVSALMPIFDALRPEGPRDEGFVHAGHVGAGHFAKMVHNGIEYGLMHAYGEGFELLKAKDIVTDVTGCFKAWSRGTVVRSWLLDLMVKALEEHEGLDNVSEYTTDSGEGRWAVQEAVDLAVPAPVMSAALFARFTSRQENSPTMQAVAALRGQFGGHAVRMRDEAQEQVSPAAEPKRDGGERLGAGDTPAAVEAAAPEAGPTSGTGETS